MDYFSNETLNLNELPDYTQANLTSIAKSYIKVLIFNLIIFSIIILAGAVSVFYFFLEKETLLLKTLIVASVIVFLTLFNTFYLIAFKRKSYAFREQDVIYRSGILTITHEIVPYNRLQHVVLKQGWISRYLGLATIQCYTAASSANEISIPGLEKNHAEHIKDMLINKINNIELKEEEVNSEHEKEDSILDDNITNSNNLNDE